MVTVGPLDAEQRRTLRQLTRRAVGRVALRAQMVLLSSRGYPVVQIAAIFEVGEDVVRTWLHRYRQDGPDGFGGPSPAGQAAQGSPGPADRRRADAQLAARQWPGAGGL